MSKRRRRSGRDTYNYTMRDASGRVAKYGITSHPLLRARQNISKGLGVKMEITDPPATRKTARRRERGKIAWYEALVGRKPRGNKRL